MRCATTETLHEALCMQDLVIWKDSDTTAWSTDWSPVNYPCVVMEWKVSRSARPKEAFDDHDTEWLRAFTREYSGTLGYLVQAFHGQGYRGVHWAKVARGAVLPRNRRA
jgi:hypothetical protein